MKKLICFLLVTVFLLSFSMGAFAVDGKKTIDNGPSPYLQRYGFCMGSYIYIYDDEYTAGRVKFFSSVAENENSYIYDYISGLKNVVQIVQSANCDFDFETAFLLSDGTVICTDECDCFKGLKNVIKLSDDASYALLKNGTVVSTYSGETVKGIKNAVDIAGYYWNCFALDKSGKVVPVTSSCSKAEEERLTGLKDIRYIALDRNRDLYACDAKGNKHYAVQSSNEAADKDFISMMVEANLEMFDISERPEISNYCLDFTHDMKEDHLMIVPVDYMHDDKICKVNGFGEKTDSCKIFLFDSDGRLLYADEANLDRAYRYELYTTFIDNELYLMKSFGEEDLDGWSWGMKLYYISPEGKVCDKIPETHLLGRKGDKEAENEKFQKMTELDYFGLLSSSTTLIAHP